MRLPRHVDEEGARLAQVVAPAAAERGEDGVVGDGVADVRERGEEGARLRHGRPAEAAVEERRGVRAAPAEEHGEERRRGAGRLRGREGGRWERRVGGRDGGGGQGPDETGLQALPHGGTAAGGAGSVAAGGGRRAAPRRLGFSKRSFVSARPRGVRWLGLPRGKIIEWAFGWAPGLPRRTWAGQLDSCTVSACRDRDRDRDQTAWFLQGWAWVWAC